MAEIATADAGAGVRRLTVQHRVLRRRRRAAAGSSRSTAAWRRSSHHWCGPSTGCPTYELQLELACGGRPELPPARDGVVAASFLLRTYRTPSSARPIRPPFVRRCRAPTSSCSSASGSGCPRTTTTCCRTGSRWWRCQGRPRVAVRALRGGRRPPAVRPDAGSEVGPGTRARAPAQTSRRRAAGRHRPARRPVRPATSSAEAGRPPRSQSERADAEREVRTAAPRLAGRPGRPRPPAAGAALDVQHQRAVRRVALRRQRAGTSEQVHPHGRRSPSRERARRGSASRQRIGSSSGRLSTRTVATRSMSSRNRQTAACPSVVVQHSSSHSITPAGTPCSQMSSWRRSS